MEWTCLLIQYICVSCDCVCTRQYCSGRSFWETVIYFSGQPCDEKETSGHCALTSLIREWEGVCVCGVRCDEAVRTVRNKMESTLNAPKTHFTLWVHLVQQFLIWGWYWPVPRLWYAICWCLERAIRMASLGMFMIRPREKHKLASEWEEFLLYLPSLVWLVNWLLWLT